MLAQRAMGNRMPFVGPDHRVVAVREPTELVAEPGETWSFWTFDPGVRVSLEGVRWPVTERPLDVGGRPSISNQAVATSVAVGPVGGAVVASGADLDRFIAFESIVNGTVPPAP